MAINNYQGPMAGTGSPQSNKATPPRQFKGEQGGLRKPIQVVHISRKDDKEKPNSNSNNINEASEESLANSKPDNPEEKSISSNYLQKFQEQQDHIDFDADKAEGISMADLLGPPDEKLQKSSLEQKRIVDEFDFDEDEFLAALEGSEPIGNTGEVAKGAVIGVESDGVYVDIGGKAPGFMPKNECGLGVITNLKEKFPKGLEIEVLVTREQNADGMVTISLRALALRQSWEKVLELEKEGKVVKVTVNGFNRGGVTCDLEGLRGFIPRSQLEDGANHESLVGKILSVAFLEVNSVSRKLVLSEKRAAIATRFSELEIGQLIEGKVSAIKPYGFFIDLNGISGLLHHSMVTNGSIRSLREVFQIGEVIKSLIIELDPKRGRVSLNTALLEGPPGELISEKDKVLSEASERAKKAIEIIKEVEKKKKEEREINK